MKGNEVGTKGGRVARSGRVWRKSRMSCGTEGTYASRVGLGEDMGQEDSPARIWKQRFETE